MGTFFSESTYTSHLVHIIIQEGDVGLETMRFTDTSTIDPVRVLLVEDEPIVMITHTSELAKRGFSVLTASTGEDAVKTVAEDPSIDLVLMDIDLGDGINGVEAARRVLEHRQVPIVFLTAHAEPDVVDQVRNVTRYGYVLKSSGIFVLTQAISMALDLHYRNDTLLGANRALLSLSTANRRLLEARQGLSEYDFLRFICDILVKDGRYRHVQVILPEGASGSATVLASAGDTVYPSSVPIVPCTTLERTEVVSGGPGDRSDSEPGVAILLPLVVNEAAWACLAIFEDRRGGFGPEERLVLEEIARSVSIGFNVIETRRQRAAARIAVEERAQQLEARVRETRCLYELSDLLARSDGDVAATLRGVADLIPRALRFPQVAEVRIACCDNEETTSRFQRTDQAIRVVESVHTTAAHGSAEMEIEVSYLETVPETDNGPFTADEQALLAAVARRLAEFRAGVENTRAYRQARAELDETNARLDQALWGARAGVWEWHLPSGHMIVNDRWAEMIGYSLNELSDVTRATWESLCHPEDVERARSVLDSHFRGELDHYHMEIRVRHKVGDWIWTLDQGAIIERTDSGAPLRMAGTLIDITSLKQEQEKIALQRTRVETLLREKDMLLHEVHHRVKNDLALVRSLFSLQASSAENRETKVALNEAGQRIAAIAAIYELIRHSDEEKTVTLDPIVRNIVEKNQLGKTAETASTTIEIEDIQVSIRFAMSIGLIVNELVTNSFKYGRSEDGVVRLYVRAGREEDGSIVIVVGDEGAGFTGGGNDAPQSTGFGRLVVESLVEQYDGSIRRDTSNGARVEMRFPDGSY